MKLSKKIPLKTWCFSLLFLLITFFSLTNIFSNFDLFFYDLYFKLRPKPPVSNDIVIIEIEDETLNKLSAWPLPRDFHGSLIKILGELGAEAVVFDIIFSEPTGYDKSFAQEIKKEEVYLPVVFYLNKYLANNYQPPEAEKKIVDIQADIRKSASGIGQINVFVDPDGKIRKAPLFIRYQDKLYPHLALKAAAARLGLDLEGVKFKKREVVINDRLRVPVSENNAFFVNFPDKWGKAFSHFSYLGILKSYRNLKQGKKPNLDLSKLKNKICFIGLTAAGTTDLKPMPLEGSYPMLGLQASAYNSLINEDFIGKASFLLNLIIALFIFILIFWLVLNLPPLKSLFISLSLVLGFFLTAFFLFSYFNLWIDSFLPLTVIALVYTGGVIVRFLEERKNKEILEKELDIARKIQESFLPKGVEGIPGMDLSCYMKPAKFVAGDLYDVIKLDKNKVGVFLADVSGKGASAALIMAQTISIFRILAKESSNPADVLTNLNKELSKTLKGKFVTAIYLIFDISQRQVNYSSAGHMPPLHYGKEKTKAWEVNFEAGIPLGVMGSAEYELHREEIGLDDKIIVYTDGISEARNKKGEDFEIEGLKNFLSRYGGRSCQGIKDKLIQELNFFTKKTPQADDITFVIAAISG